MDRYDRLVRYTIFRASRDRCGKDPAWLDDVASATWTGFVQGLRRAPQDTPRSVPTLLITIARNQVVSALRRHASRVRRKQADIEGHDIATAADDPIALLQELEDLTHLQNCVSSLGEEDRLILTQLPAIMDRRWEDAAGALGRAESTLRSQWKGLLARLRDGFSGQRDHRAEGGRERQLG